MLRHPRPAGLAAALLGAALAAQVPDNPPPWWGVADNDTVSLYWSFDNQAAPLVPTFQVVPAWYVFPPNSGFTLSANVGWIANLSGHAGVLGFTGSGTGTVAEAVDNDPRFDWIKVFFFQFDSFAGGASTVSAAIREDLAQYSRSIISEQTVPLANGWVRTTVDAQLLPQPNYEAVDFTLTAAALATVAVDDLYINSKCIKPPPDETGDALGDVDQSLLNGDLGARTGNPDCTAVAATEDQNGVLSYWVAARSPTAAQFHSIVRLNQSGVATASTPLNETPAQAPLGVTDLTVARFPGPGGTTLQFVYGIIDRRSVGGGVGLVAIDAATGLLLPPPRSFTLVGFPAGVPTQPFGLAFSPHGDLGNGSFWVSDQTGNAYEFGQAGQLLGVRTNRLPAGVTGAAYDPLTAKFYWFSNAPRQPRPGLVTQVNGAETSAYDFNQTGVQFFGDLRLSNPGGPPGGVARGLELLRRSNGDFRLLCVQEAIGSGGTPTSFLRTLKGPYAFGWNLLGRCGMRGVPMEGVTNFQVTLSGVPHATFAILYGGFSDTAFAGQQLPFNLGAFGLPESNVSVALQLDSPLLPVAGGGTAYTIPLLPPGSGLSYVPMFFQWVVFDPTAPGGIATSQAGKTVIY